MEGTTLQGVSERRRVVARAVARGVALGALCALVGDWIGFASGLVAAPLACVDVWGQRRRLDAAAALVALGGALVWLFAARLQGVYVAGVIGGHGLDGAYEAVGLEAVELVSFGGPWPDGAMLLMGSLVLALAPQLQRDAKISLLLIGITSATLYLLDAVMVMLLAITMSWLPAALLEGFNRSIDSLVDAFIGSARLRGGRGGP